MVLGTEKMHEMYLQALLLSCKPGLSPKNVQAQVRRCPEAVHNDAVQHVGFVFVHIMGRAQSLSEFDMRILGLEFLGV